MPLAQQLTRRWPAHLAGILTVTGIAMLLQFQVGWLQTAEAWTRDLRNLITPQMADAPARVSVLYVTEEMLDELEYRVPVNRAYLAKLLEPLREAGPSALGLDILFDHPTQQDDTLRDTLSSLPYPVVYAWIGEMHGLRPRQIANLESFIGSGTRGLATFLAGSRDGVVRELPSAQGTRRIAPMAAVLAELAGGIQTPLPRPLAYPPILGESAPWVRAFPLNYLDRILARDPDVFRDQVVLVGVKSPLRDLHRISFISSDTAQGELPGVLIHAHAVAQILQGYDLKLLPQPFALILVVLLASAGWILGLQDVRLFAQVLLGIGLVVAYGALSSLTYASTGWFLPLIAPCLALILGLMISALAEGGQLRRQRSTVRKVFSQYVPKQVVDQLIDTPSTDLLQGQRVTVTCLFTDIAGFTSLAETMDPVRLVDLMNRYFDGITRIIHAHEGTVDKFIGDAVLAFFGAPLAQPDHADRAVTAGIEIRRFTDDLRQRLANEGLVLGETRIGIHTGEAVIGNIGGELRQNYTAIGDAVNLASRLEGANRYLGSAVCVSEATVELASRHPCRPLARIVVKGRRQPVEVHEPLAVHDHDPDYVARYAAAYGSMTAQDQDGALQLFRALQREMPEDPVVAMHVERLESDDTDPVISLGGK